MCQKIHFIGVLKKASLESSLHSNLLGRFRKVLSDNQEQDLNKYIKDMDNSFYGLSMMDIRLLVFEFCKKKINSKSIYQR